MAERQQRTLEPGGHMGRPIEPSTNHATNEPDQYHPLPQVGLAETPDLCVAKVQAGSACAGETAVRGFYTSFAGRRPALRVDF